MKHVAALLNTLKREWEIFCLAMEWPIEHRGSVPEQVELMRKWLATVKREQARAFLATAPPEVQDALGGNFLWR